MEPSPYAPPKAQVADLLPGAPLRWGRAAWLHLPLFALLVAICFLERAALGPGLAGWGLGAGLLCTAGLAYFPLRALHTLSEKAPPWWSDAVYYTTVLAFLGGLAINEANLLVAGGAPTVLLNGVAGAMALVVERRSRVRVYVSGRRYLFCAKTLA